MGVLVFAAVSWLLAIWVGQHIGAPKGRAGWAWGLFLGWVGVLVVALLSDKNTRHFGPSAEEHRIAKLEADRWLAERDAHRWVTELRQRNAGAQR